MRRFIYALFFIGLSVSTQAFAQSGPSDEQILKLINLGSPGEPEFYPGDFGEADKHPMDLNGDGTMEWVITPTTGCGETKNCLFYVLGAEKKGWRRLLKGEGKVTGVTPIGFLVAPHQTKGYSDLLAVVDLGPEGNGTRSLERHIYLFTGAMYARYSDTYPPSDASPAVAAMLKQLDGLKYGAKKR